MLAPRYLYEGDFAQFRPYLERQSHVVRRFMPREVLWLRNEHLKNVYYIASGVACASIVDESGRERIQYFSGDGSLVPGCHTSRFKLEQSLEVFAVTEVEAFEFDLLEFRDVVLRNNYDLQCALVESYAAQINALLYEAAHQSFNSAYVRVCNLLHVLSHRGDRFVPEIPFTQKMIAEVVGMERESVTRQLSKLKREGVIGVSRGKILIEDEEKLCDLCTYETLP